MGLATCKALAAQGWKISIADMNQQAGESAASNVQGLFTQSDVTKYESLAEAFVRTRKEYGRIDFGVFISQMWWSSF